MRLPVGFLLSAAFVLGVALEASDLFVPVIAFLVGAIAIAWIWTENRTIVILGVVFVLIVTAGTIRVQGRDGYPAAPADILHANSFQGVVIDVPRQYPTATHVRIDLHEPSEARVWAQLPPFPSVDQGDRVGLAGNFTPNEKTSFRGFAAQRDTTGVLNADSLVVTGNQAPLHQRWRTLAGNEISHRIRERVPEPAGAFATGVILGDDGAMTEATRESFRIGGLTHMTAVSGIHVGVIAAVILLLSRLGFISRWWMLGLSIPVIWTFAYLVGMRPSVVRASLMLTLLIVAQLLGRPRDTLNAVGLASAAMLLVDPSFRHDAGFQLSVAATTGIAFGVLLVGTRSHWHLIWVVPVSAQMATEPLILYHFGYYSLVSPFANILAAPFLAVTMAMSILTVVSSFLSGILADALAIATWLPASAVVMIADYAAGVPYLSNDVQPLGLTGVWAAYACLAGFVAILFVFVGDQTTAEDSDFSLLYRV